jgi:hypothetical protein
MMQIFNPRSIGRNCFIYCVFCAFFATGCKLRSSQLKRVDEPSGSGETKKNIEILQKFATDLLSSKKDADDFSRIADQALELPDGTTDLSRIFGGVEIDRKCFRDDYYWFKGNENDITSGNHFDQMRLQVESIVEFLEKYYVDLGGRADMSVFKFSRVKICADDGEPSMQLAGKELSLKVQVKNGWVYDDYSNLSADQLRSLWDQGAILESLFSSNSQSDEWGFIRDVMKSEYEKLKKLSPAEQRKNLMFRGVWAIVNPVGILQRSIRSGFVTRGRNFIRDVLSRGMESSLFADLKDGVANNDQPSSGSLADIDMKAVSRAIPGVLGKLEKIANDPVMKQKFLDVWRQQLSSVELAHNYAMIGMAKVSDIIEDSDADYKVKGDIVVVNYHKIGVHIGTGYSDTYNLVSIPPTNRKKSSLKYNIEGRIVVATADYVDVDIQTIVEKSTPKVMPTASLIKALEQM